MALQLDKILDLDFEDLWTTDIAALTGLTRIKVRGARLGILLFEEFKRGMLDLQAKSLVYTTLLSLVPFLAVTFSILTAFGASQEIGPVLKSLFKPLGVQGSTVVSQWVVEFVKNVQVGVLGVLGFVTLFYFVLSLVGKIENALNYIWRVPRGRPLTRRFTDYLSVVLVGPTLLFTAFTLTASAQSHWLIQYLLEAETLGVVFVMITRVMPFLVLCGMFTFLYKFLPNTHVQFRSALLGGATASLLWIIAGAVFTAFVADAPDRVAIYRSFAVAIFFFIWLYLGWCVILIGSLVAYLHQHAETRLESLSRREHGALFHVQLALSVLVTITRRYLAGETPWPSIDLATELQVSPAELEDVVEPCVNTGILCRTAEPEGLVLGRPPEAVAVADVFAIIEGADEIQVDAGRRSENPVGQVLAQRSQALRHSFAEVTLRSLALTASGIALAASASVASDESEAEESENGLADSTAIVLTEDVPTAPSI